MRLVDRQTEPGPGMKVWPYGTIDKVAPLVTPLAVPLMLTLVVARTWLVEIENVAEVAPAITVTLGGTVAAGWELKRDTVMLPGAAGHSRITVPTAELPPTTFVGETVTDFGGMGLTVTVPVLYLPFAVAVTPTPVDAATGCVVNKKV